MHELSLVEINNSLLMYLDLILIFYKDIKGSMLSVEKGNSDRILVTRCGT